MLTAFAIVAATLFVAYVTGANDNFKGVATLFGSGTTEYNTGRGTWSLKDLVPIQEREWQNFSGMLKTPFANVTR